MISSSCSAQSPYFDTCGDDAVEQNVKEKDSLSEDETSSISRSSSDREWTSDGEEWTTDSDDDDEMSSIKAEDDDDDDDHCCFQKKELVPESSLEGRNDAYAQMVKRFKNSMPSPQKWIASWSELRPPVGHWLSVYGYCNKNRGYGGYGVILRNNWVQPIAAATFFTPEGGQSQFFQVLNGLKAGFELAVERKNALVHVVCNVRKAVSLLGSCTFQDAGRCNASDDSHVKKEGICKECTKRCVLMKTATLESLIPLMAKLKEMQAKVKADSLPFLFSKVSRIENEAGHYLAKRAKVEAHGVKSQKVIKPRDFPPKLQNILYNDAYGFDTRYCHALKFHEGMAYKQQIEQKSVL